jgi:hypothetical protein
LSSYKKPIVSGVYVFHIYALAFFIIRSILFLEAMGVLLKKDIKLSEEEEKIFAEREQARKEKLFSEAFLEVTKRLTLAEEYRKEISKQIS